MKRILAFALALLLLLPSMAFADVIVEPENSFYRTHRNECHHQEGRTYLANGPDGSLNIYTAPNGTVSKTLSNGTAFYCQWTYTDKQGVVWGFSERHEAWAPLGYTLVQYDHISFEEEHAEEIKRNADVVLQAEKAFFYEYPGAPDGFLMEGVSGTPFSQCYVDEEGRQWGFVHYLYGVRNKWVCLDDPVNDKLTNERKAPVSSGYEAPAKLPTASTRGVIAGVVCAVALITLMVVLILFRRKKVVC